MECLRATNGRDESGRQLRCRRNQAAAAQGCHCLHRTLCSLAGQSIHSPVVRKVYGKHTIGSLRCEVPAATLDWPRPRRTPRCQATTWLHTAECNTDCCVRASVARVQEAVRHGGTAPQRPRPCRPPHRQRPSVVSKRSEKRPVVHNIGLLRISVAARSTAWAAGTRPCDPRCSTCLLHPVSVEGLICCRKDFMSGVHIAGTNRLVAQ